MRKLLAAHVSFYTAYAGAWFGVGPVWGEGRKVIGVAVSIGDWGIAVHRRMDG